jgi:ATP-dependent RNA circularization protein (DNA/RNA ligase family)
MEYKSYMHIEKFGREEVEGIELGDCYIFPKIDGTASVLWIDDNGEIKAGSRTRELSLGKDNANFYSSVLDQGQFKGIKELLKTHSNYIVFGEWLVPHSLRTYRDDAWRKFYLYDILAIDGENTRYLSYDEYEPLCKEYEINYIPCLAKIRNGSYEQFIHVMNQNNYLIKDGMGIGEGIVIKNNNFKNKYGRTTWAKIVTSEFKEKHIKEMGPNEIDNKMIEDRIIAEYLTEAMISKIQAKIVNEVGEWNNKYINRLIETCFHDLVIEELWTVIKDLKQPTINFKTLRHFVVIKVKQYLGL